MRRKEILEISLFLLVLLSIQIIGTPVSTIIATNSHDSTTILEQYIPRLDQNGTAYISFKNSTGTYRTQSSQTTQIDVVAGSGSAIKDFPINFAMGESNSTHIWVIDPTNKTDGYYISVDDTYIELNASRGQSNQHWYNVSSEEYTYNSAQLVYKEDVHSQTNWLMSEEYPNRYIVRLTNGSMYFFETPTEIEDFIGTIDNSTLWAIGYEGVDGITAIYLNFADTNWGHGQYLYYARFKNGSLPAYNMPTFAMYLHLYVNYTGTIYDAILNNRALYDSPSKNPRNTLSFSSGGDVYTVKFTTYNISILGSNWDFVQGFKYNKTLESFSYIHDIRCNDRNFTDIGWAYEIASSPQTDGTEYRPYYFNFANDTYIVTKNASEVWDANTILNNVYDRVNIDSYNHETGFLFNFEDMRLAGFTQQYLSLHDQLFPNSLNRRVLRVGMATTPMAHG